MNIKEIYEDKEQFFVEEVCKMYNEFAKNLEQDEDYTLADDEVNELFNELLLKYIAFTMPKTEWYRVLGSIAK